MAAQKRRAEGTNQEQESETHHEPADDPGIRDAVPCRGEETEVPELKQASHVGAVTIGELHDLGDVGHESRNDEREKGLESQ